MTAEERKRHERNQQRQNPALPSEGRDPVPDSRKDIWLARGGLARPAGVLWLKRPMPDGRWPPNQRAPRDDSFSWWIRSNCGHQGGAKQWAFTEERYADMYESIFREDPCRWTQCQDRKRQEER